MKKKIFYYPGAGGAIQKLKDFGASRERKKKELPLGSTSHTSFLLAKSRPEKNGRLE